MAPVGWLRRLGMVCRLTKNRAHSFFESITHNVQYHPCWYVKYNHINWTTITKWWIDFGWAQSNTELVVTCQGPTGLTACLGGIGCLVMATGHGTNDVRNQEQSWFLCAMQQDQTWGVHMVPAFLQRWVAMVQLLRLTKHRIGYHIDGTSQGLSNVYKWYGFSLSDEWTWYRNYIWPNTESWTITNTATSIGPGRSTCGFIMTASGLGSNTKDILHTKWRP